MPDFKKTKFYLIGATIVCLLAGFADLWRGGTTVSAFLLAIGYCVLVPLVIWHAGSAPSVREEREAPSYGVAAIVGVVILVLYLLTMAPSTAMWDTSEYIAAAYTFGLPHPPGNPFFVIVGHLFSLLPIASNVAARINVLAALSSAAAAAMWFLVAEQVLRGWFTERWLRITGGVLAAVIGATAFTVWNQSVVNEKVYTVSLAGIAIVAWLAVRWSDEPDDPGASRLLVMIAYLCGLGYANHMAGMLPAPAVAVAVLVRRPSTVVRWKLLLACLGALVIGVTPFATQPIRAAHFPAMNEGEPTACRTQIELKCTLSAGTYDAFMYNFNRGQYGKPALSERQATIGQQVGMWWLYFEWQWLRDPDGRFPFPQALLAASFFVLGLLGAWVHFRRDRKSFWFFGALMFTMTLALIYYLNFKLGAAQDPSSEAPHEVRDRDYFFLWSYSAWGVWAALGLAYVWESLASLIPDSNRAATGSLPSKRSWLATSPLLALALVPLGGNWSSASRAHQHATRDIAADMLNSVEPYGVLITVGDNDTFPLWYAQEVEGIRRDVVVANTSLLGTDWYARQLIRRPIYDYDEAHGPVIYRGKTWVKPTTPPLHMTFGAADSVAPYYDLPKPVEFSVGDLRVTVDERKLEFGVLTRADALVLRIIQDSWKDRPVYFARSAVGYPTALGMENNILTQGLAYKIFAPPANAGQPKDTVRIANDGWLDVKRSTALWDSVFTAQKSIIAQDSWVDRPSASMPAMYVFAGLELADALRATGHAAQSNAVVTTTTNLAHAAQLGSLVQSIETATHAPTDVPDTPATLDTSGVIMDAPRGRPRPPQ
ncbi:MAG TPA: DUF2723 domain-containing protein [Gemmatimonadaceae bacterium]